MAIVELGNVVDRIKDTVDKNNTDLEYYVGGEHFDFGKVEIQGKAVIKGSTIGPAFHMRFKPGDVLLMSRNPHLRKAARVNFEGLCSDVSYVCRTKDNNILLQDLLPFIFQTDSFWKFAEEHKKGSTNFFLNWSDFQKYKFYLPEIDEQKELSKVLWQFNSTLDSYEDLINKSNELLQARFIEMLDGKDIPLVSVGEILNNIRHGQSPSKNGTYHKSILTLSAITQGKFDTSCVKEGLFESKPPEDKCVSRDEFYICRGNGNKNLVGAAAYSKKDRKDLVFPDTVIAADPDTQKVTIEYLDQAWRSAFVRKQIEAGARTTNGTYKINQKVVSSIKIPLPDMEMQMQFSSFVHQVEESKTTIQLAYDDVDAMYKHVIKENLG
jgi:type I restriction enzyme S subunit